MSKTLAPSVTSRDPKGLKFISIVEGAYNKAALSEEEAQRVNDTAGLADLVGNYIAENRLSNRFKDEEVSSNFTYPKEYKGPKPIEEQIVAVAKIFDLDQSQAIEFAKNLPVLPEGAEGWFAIPSVDALAKKHSPEVTDLAEKYCWALQLVHQKIAALRSFYNYREGQMDMVHLRAHARTTQMMNQVAQAQKGDILIIAAQFGMLHRGRSVRRARDVFMSNEFGLGSFAVCCMTLVHSQRFVRWEQLHADCAGDEFVSEAGGEFGGAPYLDFRGDGLRFDTYGVGGADERCGSCSGFLPQ